MTEINDVTSLTKSVNRIAKALDQEFEGKNLTESLDAIADYIEENGTGGSGGENNDILTVYVSQDVSIIEPSEEDYPDGGVNRDTYISLDPPTIDEIGEFDNTNYIYPVTWNRSNVLQSDDIMIQSYSTGKTLKIVYCYIESKYDLEQSDYYPEEIKRPYYITGFNGDDNPTYGNHYYTYLTSGYNPNDGVGSSYVGYVIAMYDVDGETKTWSFNII